MQLNQSSESTKCDGEHRLNFLAFTRDKRTLVLGGGALAALVAAGKLARAESGVAGDLTAVVKALARFCDFGLKFALLPLRTRLAAAIWVRFGGGARRCRWGRCEREMECSLGNLPVGIKASLACSDFVEARRAGGWILPRG
jgi:hypothetical protein